MIIKGVFLVLVEVLLAELSDFSSICRKNHRVAELVDARDLKSLGCLPKHKIVFGNEIIKGVSYPDRNMFFIWLGICLVCYMYRTVFNVLAYKKHPWAKDKKIVTSVFLAMGILWFSWGNMCFTDPMRITIPGWIRYLGLVFFILGVFLFMFSHVKLRGFEDKGRLVTKGIYAKIRNPMYLGFIIWIIGFPVFTQSLITLASSAIWISLIMYWKILEEKELEKKYKEYSKYKKRTWF